LCNNVILQNIFLSFKPLVVWIYTDIESVKRFKNNWTSDRLDILLLAVLENVGGLSLAINFNLKTFISYVQ